MSLRICNRDFKVEGRLVRVARLDGDTYKFIEQPDAVIDGLKHCGSRVDLFTFTQRLPESHPAFDYPWEWDNLAVLPVTTFENWWTEIGFKARNKAKQAEKKGVSLREVPFDDNLIQGISAIYNETPVRQGRRFPHFKKDLQTLRREAGTFLESSIFIGAFLNETLIGFAKLTVDETGTQAGLMHIMSLIEQRDKAPTNALIAQAVRSCAERKISYLVYSSYAYGNKKEDSLTDFKTRNGFQRFDIPRYYVPLNSIGSAAFRLKLHHTRMVDYVPEPVIARLRQVRSAWYSKTLRVSG
jgi:hypothetical protein